MAETVPTWEETIPESEAIVRSTTAPIEQTLRLLTLGGIASAEGNALRQEREARKSALRDAFQRDQFAEQQTRLRDLQDARKEFLSYEDLQGVSKVLGPEMVQAGKDVRRSLEAGSLLAAGLYKPRGTWTDVVKQLSVPRAATPEQLAEYPYQQGLRQLPESLQMAAEVPGGIAEVAPRIAAASGMQMVGVPPPIAMGLAFGLTEEGFSPKEAAVGAAIPYVGKYSGQLARELATKLKISSKAAQNLLAAIGHGGGATAYLSTITASELAGLAPEDRMEAVKKALPGTIGMLLMTMPGMKAELERGTPQQLAKLLNSAQMQAGYRPRVPDRRLGMRMQPMDQPFADPEVQALADQALRERVSGLAIPEEAAALPKLRRQLTQRVLPGRGERVLAERTREAGETLVRPTAAGLRVEPGFERTASDLLLERQKPEPMNDVERQMIQGFVDEEANAGGVIPQKVLPKGVSYRAPKEAPSPAEYQRRVERDNVEAGLTIREVEQEPEPVAPQGKPPEVTRIITATGRTLTKPGVLSALQRSRLRTALANGASEEVLVNIMRMSDRDIARRNPPTTDEGFRAARRQTEKASKEKAKTEPPKVEAPKTMDDYERYQAARIQLRDMRQRLGTAAFRSPEYMAIAGEMERIKNRNGGMPPTKPSPVVEGKAEPKSVPPTAPVGEAQAEPGAVAAAPVGQAISEPTVEAEVAQAPIAGAAPEYVSRTAVPQGITAAAAQVRRQALQEFPHIRGLVENGDIVFTDGKESWPENVKASKGSKDFEAVYLTNTGQVVFDARMFTGENAGKLGEIIVHEVAIHKGLRAALGEEVFNRTTIDIWSNLSAEEKIAILKKTGTKLMPVSEQMQQIVGEEWLAYESQRVARTGVTTTVWTKIADGFRKALRAIGFKRSLSDTEIAMMISKGWEGLKAKEQAKSAEIPESAKENAVSVSNAETSPVAVNTLDGVATARFSLRTWEATDQKKLVEDLVTSGIADRRTATKWMRDISNVAAMIVRNREQMDYNASPEFASLKANADAYYTLSEDYSTICRKGAKLLATVAQIMVREGGITSEQMWKVRSLLRDKGEEVTCAACYVWSRKINIGPQLDRIAAKYPEIPHEILFDPQKSDILKRDYPKAWAMLMKAGSGIGKAFEVRSEYSREILSNKQITPDFVKRQNMFSGLRSQSWSDFEIQHLIDKMQSAADKALVGLMGHSYTKVPQYVELVAATGEMTNMSLIPLGKGLDASGRLVFDDVEGMPFAESMRLRNLHDKTAGTVIIGATDAHIIACMKDGRIDYIIPYHKSGLNVTLRKAGELAGWRDYEKEQKEGIADPAKFADYMAWKKSQGFNKAQSEVRPWEYWDKTADGNTNAQNYLAYCEKNGIIPKFQRFAGMDGYWKLLVDRRMYDNQNRYIEQQVIKPNFDMKVVGRLVDSYLRGEWKGRGDDTPDMDVVSEVLKGKEMQRAQQAQIVSEFRKAEGPGEVISAEPGFRAAMGGTKESSVDKFFSEKAFDVEGFKSRSKIVVMPIDDFLKMAAPLSEGARKTSAESSLSSGIKWESLPSLLVESAGESSKVISHEGRNRAEALKRRGFTTMPVEIRDRSIRWSEQNDPSKFDYEQVLPATLRSEKGNETIAFPITRDTATQPYQQVGAEPGFRAATRGEEKPLPQMRSTPLPYYLKSRIGDYGLYEFTNQRMGGKKLLVYRSGDPPNTYKIFPDRTLAAKWVQKEMDRQSGKSTNYKTSDGYPEVFKKWRNLSEEEQAATGDAWRAQQQSQEPPTEPGFRAAMKSRYDTEHGVQKVSFPREGEAYLYGLYVNPKFRKTGEGRRLIEQVIEDADKTGTRLISHTREDLIPFFKKFGFTTPGTDQFGVKIIREPNEAETGFRAAKTLADAKKIFEEKPKKKEPLRLMGRVRTGILSEFHPLDELSQMVADSYPYTTTRATPTGTVTVSTPRKAKAIAGIFEQLKGSWGKGEAEVYRFDRDVSKDIKGNETNFNVYMFANRTLDRLAQDARQGITRRKVADWTMADAQTVLRQLEAEVGFDTFDKFRRAAAKYQTYMDRALLLQVASGRMSQQQYNVIKAGNQFYAPFKVMKHIELQDQPEGTGKKVDTMADYTKAMEGVEDPDLRLGDMLAAGRQAILVSRTLADKAMAMSNIADLAVIDSKGLFVRKMFKGQNPREGFEAVNVYENGKVFKYEVPKFVAQAIQAMGPMSNGMYMKFLSRASLPFRVGATGFNVGFQASNLLADVPRAALVSKYGVRAVSDAYRYPLDFIDALFSSMGANVLGIKNQTYIDFLESGAAGSSVQEFLMPKHLLRKESLGAKAFANTFGKLGDFAQAIEQTSKVMGIKRAIRFEKVKSGAELAKLYPEAITEIRRFSGSPDFGRQGAWTQKARLNFLYMFFNARVQGTAADMGRLLGADGAKTAAITWARLIAAVGIPSVLLYLFNNSSDDLREGYKQRSDFEKKNYWLIPKDTFITTEDGERIRDYWRIPKRESAKWVGNLAESALEFAEKKDPEAFKEFSISMLEDVSPVNVQGETFQERLESVGASLHPFLKTGIEAATGRDMYRHQNYVPEIMRGAKTPELQFKDRTPELFKWAAEAMPDIAPSLFRSPIMLEAMTKNMTAGLITQFLPKKPIEGRTSWENTPLLQRFQAMPYIDTDKKQKLIDELKSESVDNYLIRHRKAQKYIEDNKGVDLDVVMGKAYEAGDLQDVKLANHLVDLYVAKQNGVNAVERRLIALPAEQRAKYVLQALSEKTGDAKAKLWEDWVRKRVLTEATLMEMMKQDPEAKYAPIGPGIPKEAAPLNVPSYEETVPVNR